MEGGQRMTERKPLSKKLRFDVFKRDGFSCQYCGQKPPAVTLQVDHVVPVSKGGKNGHENLITACFECNAGKSNHPLTEVPDSLVQRAALVAEKREQMKAMDKHCRDILKAVDCSVSTVEQAFQVHFPKAAFSAKFRLSVARFLETFLTVELVNFMHSACSKRHDSPEQSIKYFCGICWGVIKERQRVKS